MSSATFLLLAAAATVLLSAAPASAHAFLATTDPEEAARLRQSPENLALQFSEEVVEGSIGINLRTEAGVVTAQPVPRLESRGRVARVPLSVLPDDVYVVSWQVTSAVDGHEAAGEFAFAVGGAAPGDPRSSSVDVDVNAAGVAATWIFFAGLAGAVGGVVGSRLLGDDSVARRSWLRIGALTAVVGVAWQTWLATSGAAARLQLVSLLVALVALILTIVAARATSAVPAAGLLSAAAFAWSARSHSAAAGGPAGWLLDTVHIVAAAVWIGTLAYATTALWRQRADRAALLAGFGRYARLAAALVAAVAATGTAQAMLLLPGVTAMWTTGYGRILGLKSVFFAISLAAAAAARTRALPRHRPHLLQRLTASELTGLAAVLAAAALLVNAAPPERAASASLLGPPPMEGDVVHDMGMAGALTVAVKAGDGRLDVEVLTPSGGAEGAEAAVLAKYPDGTSVELSPRACGAGCYTQELTLPTGRTSLAVRAEAPQWTGGTMTATLDWPPAKSQRARFQRMLTAMRRAPSLRLTEQVSSGAGPGAASEAELSGKQFVALVPWANGGVTDVRQHGGDGSAFSFYLPGSSMYFIAWVDERDRLTAHRMVNPGHVIEYSFSYPDG